VNTEAAIDTLGSKCGDHLADGILGFGYCHTVSRYLIRQLAQRKRATETDNNDILSLAELLYHVLNGSPRH
jgi:hypothetical protein